MGTGLERQERPQLLDRVSTAGHTSQGGLRILHSIRSSRFRRQARVGTPAGD